MRVHQVSFRQSIATRIVTIRRDCTQAEAIEEAAAYIGERLTSKTDVVARSGLFEEGVIACETSPHGEFSCLTPHGVGAEGWWRPEIRDA